MRNLIVTGRWANRRRWLGVAAAVTAATLMATGCSSGGSSSSSNGKVTLNFSWWGDDTRAKVTQDAISQFEKQHPNITIKT